MSTEERPHLPQKVPSDRFDRVAQRWACWMEKARWLVLAVSLLIASLSVWAAVSTLSINTNTKDMLSPDLPFNKNYFAHEQAFPLLGETIFVVLEAKAENYPSWRLDQVTQDFVQALGKKKEAVKAVYWPEGNDFFRHNGLLFSNAADLQTIAQQLIMVGPFLEGLATDLSFANFVALLEKNSANLAPAPLIETGEALLDSSAAPLPVASVETQHFMALYQQLFTAMAMTLEERLAEKPAGLDWSVLWGGAVPYPQGTGSHGQPLRRIVMLLPNFDFTALQPAETTLKAIEETILEIGLSDHPHILVRRTGEPVLAYDEIGTIESNIGLLGAASFILVAIVLGFGVRSGRLVSTLLLTLITGLAITAGLATILVGHLNLLSVAFAVLFIGLGIDVGIHFVLRYREERRRHYPHRDALAISLRHQAGPLSLCMVSSAMGFLAFSVTDYLGLGELGVIAGAGMMVALVMNLTLLPALLSLVSPASDEKGGHGLDKWQRIGRQGRGEKWAAHLFTRLAQIVEHRAKIIVLCWLAIAVLSAFALPASRFDSDPINLRDQNSEAVRLFRDLQQQPEANPYHMSLMRPSLAEAQSLAEQLLALPEVAQVVTLKSFTPEDSAEKRAIIAQLASSLATEGWDPHFEAVDVENLRPAFIRLQSLLAWMAERFETMPMSAQDQQHENFTKALRRLEKAVQALNPAEAKPSLIASAEEALIAGLPNSLLHLKALLRPTEEADLKVPDSIQSRYLTEKGLARLEVFPTDSLVEQKALEDFVIAVLKVAPDATGTPAVVMGAGQAVVEAFYEAFLLALLTISVLLYLVLRRFIDCLLVLLPLAAAAMLTLAIGVLMGQPFNFANVIVLPLLLGIGVDNGIHLVMRAREAEALHHDKLQDKAAITDTDEMPAGKSLLASGGLYSLLRGSTPLAVLISALTTIASFGTLALSAHPGTASMGLLLAMAVAMNFMTTVILLPSVLALRTASIRAKRRGG